MFKNKPLIVFTILALFIATCPVIAQSRKFEKSKLEALAKELDTDPFILEMDLEDLLENVPKDAKHCTFSLNGKKITIDLETLTVVQDPLQAELARRQQEDSPTPYTDVYKKPTFKGGDVNEFLKWVKANIKYPSLAAAENVEESILVSFCIGVNGQVRSVSVINNTSVSPSIYNYSFEEEAIRVVSSSPLWEPGRDEDGLPVQVIISPFPVYFYLSQVALPQIIYDNGPWRFRYPEGNPIVHRKTIADRERELESMRYEYSSMEENQHTSSEANEVYTFSTPMDVFDFVQSRVFKSSDGITLDISPYGVTSNGRTIAGAVQVTYIQRQQAIMKATSPATGHTYTFIAYADRNCIVCSDDNTMYFGKK